MPYTGRLYYAGTSQVTVQGAAYPNTLYLSGGKVTVQGDPYTGDLYETGRHYAGGLYHSYTPSSASNAKLIPAVVNTTNVQALTVPQ